MDPEENLVAGLRQRIENLEAELRSFKYVNEELCKAINERKHKLVLTALLKDYESKVKQVSQ